MSNVRWTEIFTNADASQFSHVQYTTMVLWRHLAANRQTYVATSSVLKSFAAFPLAGLLIFLRPGTLQQSVDRRKERVSVAAPRGNQMSLTEVR